jgi:transglutaminase-like putative cysteine protease
VLIVALAGLMAILDLLPQPVGSGSSPDGEQAGASQVKKQGEPLPDSVIENLTAGLFSDFLLRAPPPPHIPVLEVTGAATTSLLKSRTSSTYDGNGWQREADTRRTRYEGETLLPLVASYHQKTEDDIEVALYKGKTGDWVTSTSFLMLPDGTTPLLTALYPVRVSTDVSLLYFPEEQVFHSEEGFPEEYTFRTVHYAFDDSVLSEAEIDPQGKYLQLHDNITPRTRELAPIITKDAKTPYQKAKAIEDYLKTNYTYDFYYEHAPEGREPNDWFLFEEKRGICVNFNSAFVILSRSLGIPARLAGGYYIRPQEEKQVVYTDQAHAWSEVKFKGLGWYNFDATGSYSPPPTVTEITSIEPVVRKGHSYMVQGTVTTENGSPADGQWVEVFINAEKETEGGLLIGEGATDSQGRFDIEAAIPSEMEVGDYHILAHCLESTRYQESWSDPLVKVVAATNLNMEVPSHVKVQEPVTLQGALAEEFGKPLAGQQIDIYLAGKKVTELATDENGQFTWKQGFDKAGAYTLKVAFAGTDYYLESSQEVEFQVLTPTAIELDAMSPDTGTEAMVHEPVLITGSLYEEISGAPLPGKEIKILINDEPLEDAITTDEKGSFQIEHIFDEVGHYQIEAKFPSVPYYWESSDKTELEVFPAQGISLWAYLTIVFTLVLAGVGGFFLYRWQKQRQLLAVSAAAVASATEAVPLPQRETSINTVTLAIDFPQIETPFPDVWRVDEPLEMVVHLADPQGGELAQKPLEIYTGSELIAQLTTDKSGTAELNHTFNEKEQYEVIVRAREAPGIGEVTARRTLRIVDYREEIVNLFETLVNWFRDLGIEIDTKLTSREIEYQVLDAGTGIPEKVIDRAVSCFEEADYSLHSITRSNYQDMYLAQREIREHGGKFTGESGDP